MMHRHSASASSNRWLLPCLDMSLNHYTSPQVPFILAASGVCDQLIAPNHEAFTESPEDNRFVCSPGFICYILSELQVEASCRSRAK